MKRWQNNIPEYLISPLTTGFRKISIGVVKDRSLVTDWIIKGTGAMPMVFMP
ncbi:hypothetical protein [Endozoicomonas atrinae]|uniref:hypothetical protein n=1 Tax=Endozoicomonas atrinae TaxID=1333660 RepID=UPI003AFF8457